MTKPAFKNISGRRDLVLTGFLFACMLLSVAPAFSQFTDYTWASNDKELTMEVSRADYGINITLLFYHASQFEFITIEKSTDPQGGFSRFKYIDLSQSVNDNILLQQRDMFPVVYRTDMFYRIKTVNKEGIINTYLPVRCPAYSKALVAN